MDKIKKRELGQISAEELFKQITSELRSQRLDLAREQSSQSEHFPDYTVVEFDRINQFNENFRPDEYETPTTASF